MSRNTDHGEQWGCKVTSSREDGELTITVRNRRPGDVPRRGAQ